jgi:hypothetical protein
LRDCAQRGKFDIVIFPAHDRPARDYARQWFPAEEF